MRRPALPPWQHRLVAIEAEFRAAAGRHAGSDTPLALVEEAMTTSVSALLRALHAPARRDRTTAGDLVRDGAQLLRTVDLVRHAYALVEGERAPALDESQRQVTRRQTWSSRPRAVEGGLAEWCSALIAPKSAPARSSLSSERTCSSMRAPPPCADSSPWRPLVSIAARNAWGRTSFSPARSRPRCTRTAMCPSEHQ